MRGVCLVLALAAWPAAAQDVARLFGRPIAAAELRDQGQASAEPMSRKLRDVVAREVLARFVAANRLQATPEEIAAYRSWEAEFRKRDLARRTARLAQIEKELGDSGMDPGKREQLTQERDVLLRLRKHDAERPAGPGSERVHAVWIEGYKVKKALYEKYGGRVGIGKWGPEPAGAMEALLREHEQRGELAIFDAGLAKAFWDAQQKEPRFLAKPEQVDFTYYWLKPPR